MIMMGMKFGEDVPFRKVYIHGLVRDAQGQKMSKSKGNTIDPFEVQDRYGTDAVRFTMSILAAPGNDIPLAPERMEGYRAFANKLWNACRFVLMRLGDSPARTDYESSDLSLVDRWILSEAQNLVGEVTRSLEEFRFDRASDALYHFVWHEFCDWYIEFVKPDLVDDGNGSDQRRMAVSRSVLLDVLDVLLRMLHPFMPFITEELWHKLPGNGGYLTTGSWPVPDSGRIDPGSQRQVESLKNLVVRIRNLRAENRIDPGKRVGLLIRPLDESMALLLEAESARVATLVRASGIEIVDRFQEGLVAARGVANGFEIAIPLEGLLDLDAERKRLAKELAKLDRDILARKKKLENDSFLQRAPEDVVEREKALHVESMEKRGRVQATLEALGGVEPR
jgi:valyl-tRNA synthetase